MNRSVNSQKHVVKKAFRNGYGPEDEDDEIIYEDLDEDDDDYDYEDEDDA